MKKTYQSPATNMFKVYAAANVLQVSNTGVGTGATLGNEYNSSDETYSRRFSSSLWDEEEDE